MDMIAQRAPALTLKSVPGFRIPRLVAHRGFAAEYPENTLLALHQALQSGACFVEFDVQFTADGVPVLFHDAALKRTTDHSGRIMDIPYSMAKTLQAAETKRFGPRFVNAGVNIPSLADAVYLLKNWPHVHAFIEVKEESLEHVGIEYAMRTLVRTMQPAIAQCTVISYNDLAIRCSRAMGARSIGWVLKSWDAVSRSNAASLTPEYIFCNYRKIPFDKEDLWPGPWQWAMYEVTNPDVAIELAAYGVELIETMAVGEMMAHPLLKQGGCFDGHCLL